MQTFNTDESKENIQLSIPIPNMCGVAILV